MAFLRLDPDGEGGWGGYYWDGDPHVCKCEECERVFLPADPDERWGLLEAVLEYPWPDDEEDGHVAVARSVKRAFVAGVG